MRPVFEHRLVDALGLLQMRTLVAGNAREEDVMMAALDHVDRVDLHVAQVLHRSASGRRTVAKRRGALEPLCPQPDVPGASLGERVGLAGHRAYQRGRMASPDAAERPRTSQSEIAPDGQELLMPLAADRLRWHAGELTQSVGDGVARPLEDGGRVAMGPPPRPGEDDVD